MRGVPSFAGCCRTPPPPPHTPGHSRSRGASWPSPARAARAGQALVVEGLAAGWGHRRLLGAMSSERCRSFGATLSVFTPSNANLRNPADAHELAERLKTEFPKLSRAGEQRGRATPLNPALEGRQLHTKKLRGLVIGVNRRARPAQPTSGRRSFHWNQGFIANAPSAALAYVPKARSPALCRHQGRKSPTRDSRARPAPGPA